MILFVIVGYWDAENNKDITISIKLQFKIDNSVILYLSTCYTLFLSIFCFHQPNTFNSRYLSCIFKEESALFSESPEKIENWVIQL